MKTDIAAPSTYVDFITSAYYKQPLIGELSPEEEEEACQREQRKDSHSKELTRKRSGSFSIGTKQQSSSNDMVTEGTARKRLFSEQTAARRLDCEEYDGLPRHRYRQA